MTCKIHGNITKTPLAFYKVGCHQCTLQEKYFTNEIFLDKFQQKHDITKYDFSKLEYKGSHKEVTIICNVHGEFTRKAYRVLQAVHACPICATTAKSYPETQITDYIKSICPDIEIIRSYRPFWLNGKELDLFLPEYNLAIEYNGSTFHHSTLGISSFLDNTYKDKNYHYNKWKLCNDNNINLLSIYDFYWLQDSYQELYKRKLREYLKIISEVSLLDCTLKLNSLSIKDIKCFHLTNNTRHFTNIRSIKKSFEFYFNDKLICSILEFKDYSCFSSTVPITIESLKNMYKEYDIKSLILNLDINSFPVISDNHLAPLSLNISKTLSIGVKDYLEVYDNGYAIYNLKEKGNE